jgi:hypothetical protein
MILNVVEVYVSQTGFMDKNNMYIATLSQDWQQSLTNHKQG